MLNLTEEKTFTFLNKKKLIYLLININYLL